MSDELLAGSASATPAAHSSRRSASPEREAPAGLAERALEHIPMPVFQVIATLILTFFWVPLMITKNLKFL